MSAMKAVKRQLSALCRHGVEKLPFISAAGKKAAVD
jgi:hypothetical protein